MRFSTFGSMLFFASTIAALSVPSIPLDTHVKRDGNLDVGPIEANIQLLLRERLGRDAQLWELLRSTYSDDAEIRLSWYKGGPDGFVNGSIKTTERAKASPGVPPAHQLGPPAVWLSPDQSKATILMGAVIGSRQMVTDSRNNSVLVDMSSNTRLVYTTRKEDDVWKIMSLDCIYSKDAMTPAIPGQSFVIDPADLAGLRTSYQYLSYSLVQRNMSVNNDLPGEDRPELVTAIYETVFSYVNQTFPPTSPVI